MKHTAAALTQDPSASHDKEPPVFGTPDTLVPPTRASLSLVEPFEFEETRLNPAQPREWHTPVAALSGKVYRQLLGLNPFKQGYLSLYGCLSGRDKTVACGAVLFAIAAGVPLPIIGVIFGRLISSFPPSEDELSTRISELLGVAVGMNAI